MILNRCAYTFQDRSGRATCPREEGRRGKFFICAEEAAKVISRQSSQSCQQRPHAERKIKNQRARNEVWTQDSQPSPCWWRANHVRSAAPWQLARTQGLEVIALLETHFHQRRPGALHGWQSKLDQEVVQVIATKLCCDNLTALPTYWKVHLIPAVCCEWVFVCCECGTPRDRVLKVPENGYELNMVICCNIFLLKVSCFVLRFLQKFLILLPESSVLLCWVTFGLSVSEMFVWC